MKKLFAILLVFLFAASAYAYNGGTKTATGSFTCKVIAPLVWSKTADIDLGVVIADGIARTTFNNGNAITFTLAAEAGYGCTLTLGTPQQVVAKPGLSLVGNWGSAVSGTFPTAATQSYTYTVTSVTAAENTPSGTTVYTLDVSAVYTNI